MVKLICPRKECKHEWDYNGNREWHTSCPNCHGSVSIKNKGGKNSLLKPNEKEPKKTGKNSLLKPNEK